MKEKSLDAQVKDPDHKYQGMTDPKKCPAFVNDFDCRSSDIDPKYRVLQQKVQHHPPMMCCPDLSSCHQQLVSGALAVGCCQDDAQRHPSAMTDRRRCSLLLSADAACRHDTLDVQEFRKVFQPHNCDLHAMNSTHFAQCLKVTLPVIDQPASDGCTFTVWCASICDCDDDASCPVGEFAAGFAQWTFR